MTRLYINAILNAILNQTVREASGGLSLYFGFYNNERLYQSHESRTPAMLYFRDKKAWKGEVIRNIELTGYKWQGSKD
ncbi:MAG: hypothetical protein AYP45_05985 [Candidatus Brocadia carolinensis]|uniref:Uncharacterized protein n=1 Tax=Candidatus Brocadia carolinensis TaxID=1004156 RepID=A0A1V4AV14_9BACT|nr:MAG: hypothetical protein AYP45_05985 [Candidatus Brocadia caroliniensis]